jgi:hypothetical protein
MIDHLCFAGIRRNLCQFSFIAKHIDQGRFAHISCDQEMHTPAYQVLDIYQLRAANDIFGVFDLHEDAR